MKFLLIKKRDVIKIVAVALALVVSIVTVTFSGFAKVYCGQTVRQIPIYSVETDEQVVALSFDASWGADNTLEILDCLTEFDVVANYFVIGSWATTYSTELKALADSGRIEIGTHSNTHPHMNSLSVSEIEQELTTSIDIIENITSQEIDLFRAPFGEYSDTLINTASDLGLYTIQWDVDSLDWQDISAYDITQRVINKVTNGSIVLMHNAGENTLEALPVMIASLINKGYTLVTIGDMIYRDNYTIDVAGRQIQNN